MLGNDATGCSQRLRTPLSQREAISGAKSSKKQENTVEKIGFPARRAYEPV